MIAESEVVEMILAVEAIWDPEDEYSYLDEGQQAELAALYCVLDRDLTTEENERLSELRKELLA